MTNCTAKEIEKYFDILSLLKKIYLIPLSHFQKPRYMFIKSKGIICQRLLTMLLLLLSLVFLLPCFTLDMMTSTTQIWLHKGTLFLWSVSYRGPRCILYPGTSLTFRSRDRNFQPTILWTKISRYRRNAYITTYIQQDMAGRRWWQNSAFGHLTIKYKKVLVTKESPFLLINKPVTKT